MSSDHPGPGCRLEPARFLAMPLLTVVPIPPPFLQTCKILVDDFLSRACMNSPCCVVIPTDADSGAGAAEVAPVLARVAQGA